MAEVLDDGSLNGTFVNGERVRRRILHHGDVLMVGRRAMRYLEVRARRQGLEQPTEELALGAAEQAAAA
jgi:pSer/pThr/pTyr-binding forkhead associated (FHA) protein